MSVLITRSISCDEDGCGNWYGQDCFQTGTELRAEAKQHGWTRGLDPGTDRCPHHSEGTR